MKKIIFPIIFLLLSISTIAQSKRDKIKALKVSFITEKLDLSESEAQQFWPIYNAYYNKTHIIRQQEIKSVRQQIKTSINSLTDEQALELLDKLSKAESKLFKERILIIDKLKGVISPRKIILLKMSEEEFGKKLFEQYKNRRKDHLKKEKP